MRNQAVILAWLLLAGAAPAEAPGDLVYLNQRAIKIPLNFKDKANIQAVTLYVSSDQGHNWQQQANCSPEQDSFSFYAPGDGLYWFAVDVIDSEGKHSLTNMDKVAPAQKIVIDTLRPQVQIVSAVRKGDTIEVAWEIQEDHPNLASMRLEYRTPETPFDTWRTVAIDPSLTGKTNFGVHSTGAVSVRMQLTDLAQNQTITLATEVPAPSAITLASTSPEPLPHGQGSLKSSPSDLSGGGLNDRGLPGEPVPAPTPGAESSNPRPVATTSSKSAPPSIEAGAPARKPTLPPLQVIKNRQVTLEYTLKDVGPSGIGRVELWLTRDDGLTWERYAEDPEVKGAQPNAHLQRTVQLPPEDGVYGIHLVVRSRAGLGKPAPKAGDPPQMRIEVDTVPPEAQLFPPVPAPGQRDTLVLTWSASDRNLAPNPITLQWTERPGGTWHTIAAQLANTGKHPWKLPPHLPDRVYLRLVVRDTAGNEGIAETREPQLVDLSEPEGVLIGVVQAPGASGIN